MILKYGSLALILSRFKLIAENNKLWQAKLAARVHDPAEKALVLMRGPAGHEGGTTRTLLRTFFSQRIGHKN